MDNVRFATIENPNETTTDIAIIDHADGSFTSMLKSTYDEMINAPTASPHQPLVEG
jgi:hypothetical protein